MISKTITSFKSETLGEKFPFHSVCESKSNFYFILHETPAMQRNELVDESSTSYILPKYPLFPPTGSPGVVALLTGSLPVPRPIGAAADSK
jgi:hypothetical protein